MVTFWNIFNSSLAALGLVENNAPNITAAMLVSPLMGPVMSITFGAMISDRDLIVNFLEICKYQYFTNIFLRNVVLYRCPSEC